MEYNNTLLNVSKAEKIERQVISFNKPGVPFALLCGPLWCEVVFPEYLLAGYHVITTWDFQLLRRSALFDSSVTVFHRFEWLLHEFQLKEEGNGFDNNSLRFIHANQNLLFYYFSNCILVFFINLMSEKTVSNVFDNFYSSVLVTVWLWGKVNWCRRNQRCICLISFKL